MSNGVIITLDAGHGEGYNTVKFRKPPYEEELTYMRNSQRHTVGFAERLSVPAGGRFFFVQRGG